MKKDVHKKELLKGFSKFSWLKYTTTGFLLITAAGLLFFSGDIFAKIAYLAACALFVFMTLADLYASIRYAASGADKMVNRVNALLSFITGGYFFLSYIYDYPLESGVIVLCGWGIIRGIMEIIGFFRSQTRQTSRLLFGFASLLSCIGLYFARVYFLSYLSGAVAALSCVCGIALVSYGQFRRASSKEARELILRTNLNGVKELPEEASSAAGTKEPAVINGDDSPVSPTDSSPALPDNETT